LRGDEKKESRGTRPGSAKAAAQVQLALEFVAALSLAEPAIRTATGNFPRARPLQ